MYDMLNMTFGLYPSIVCDKIFDITFLHTYVHNFIEDIPNISCLIRKVKLFFEQKRECFIAYRI